MDETGPERALATAGGPGGVADGQRLVLRVLLPRDGGLETRKRLEALFAGRATIESADDEVWIWLEDRFKDAATAAAAARALSDRIGAPVEPEVMSGGALPPGSRSPRESWLAQLSGFSPDRQRRILADRQVGVVGRNMEVARREPGDDAADLPATAELIGRFESVVLALRDRGELEPTDALRLLDHVRRPGEGALSRLRVGLPLEADHRIALEALIAADGSRPSFLLENGLPPLEHPLLGVWGDEFWARQDAVRGFAEAVGRIQPVDGSSSNFIGTGTLIDRDKGLVLTNFHVLDDARNRWFIGMTQDDRTVTVEDHLEIDFIGEAGRPDTNRFRIVEARLPEGYGRGFAGVDIAVLRLDTAGGELPQTSITFSADPAYAHGCAGHGDLWTIGFPADLKRVGREGDIDWDWIYRVLFGNKFGVKRIAPGKHYRPLGAHPLDTSHLAFGHDATTFGGASGSLVCAWRDAGAPAFGVHFRGVDFESNHAIAIASTADALREIGVPV